MSTPIGARHLPKALSCLVLFLCAPGPAAAQSPRQPVLTELDTFMEKVLARREQNRITLQQYVLDEVEQFELIGPGRLPLHRQHREFTWYVRDGLHVRSPVRFNGVTVGERERAAYEEDWTRRERARLERRRKREQEKQGKDEQDAKDEAAAVPAGATPIPTPRFVSEAYFMEFKFEPGNYYLAGREQLEGKEVLRIEYYPKQMFGGDRDRERERERSEARGQPEREADDRIDRQMNKTSLVTLWVDPSEHQIVKYTFDNVWLDFLPAGWLVRVDEIRASMTMGQPFPGVWLPREMSVHGGVTLAPGSFDGTYGRRFSNYKLADVTTRIRVPKPPAPFAPETDDIDGSGPFVPDATQPRETVVEIRVHGNAFIPDADVIGLSGITLGQPFSDDLLPAIEQRLRQSGRFESVEVRKRYRSLTDLGEVSLLLVVHERPGVTSAEEPGPGARTWKRFSNRFMFLPILSYEDGYGLTYGVRMSTAGLLGAGERLSVPLTWGGTRRAALEFERLFDTGLLTRVESTFGIWQRENPHDDIDDRRVQWTARAERHFDTVVRAGVQTTAGQVDFGGLDDRLWTLGADVALDTRLDPAFPRNAVYLGAGWTGLHPRGRSRVNRYVADARGYAGLIGQSVLAGRVQYSAADAPLPVYERLLVGGASTLRGFRAGSFSGDRTFVTSAEIRVPITSVLSGAKIGLTGFVDAARAYDIGQRFGDIEWQRAAGGGLFLIAPFVRLNLDVARGFRSGGTRVHLGMGFAF